MRVQDVVKNALNDPSFAAKLKDQANAFAATGKVVDGQELFQHFAMDPSQLQDLTPAQDPANVGEVVARGTTTTTTITTTVGPETTFTTTTTTTTDK